MKKVIALVALVGLAALVGIVAYVGLERGSTTELDSLEEVMFYDYKVHHNKAYFNDEEHQFRFKVWKDARAKIMEHNANPERSFTMGLTHFSDLTTDEFLRLYTGANPDLMPKQDEEGGRIVYFDSVLS